MRGERSGEASWKQRRRRTGQGVLGRGHGAEVRALTSCPVGLGALGGMSTLCLGPQPRVLAWICLGAEGPFSCMGAEGGRGADAH